MTFREGQAYVDAVNTAHDVRNTGSTPARTLVVFAGEEGKPNLARP